MSDYTGNVVVGGPAAVRELPHLRITKIAIGPFDNNAYLLQCKATGDQLLIDAAAEPERLLEEAASGQLMKVVTTHQHSDHWQGLEAVVGVTGARTAGHPLDADGLPIPVLDLVEHGSTITFGDCELTVIHYEGTHRGASRCVTTTQRAESTSSPATRCSPGVSATPRRTRHGSPR